MSPAASPPEPEPEPEPAAAAAAADDSGLARLLRKPRLAIDPALVGTYHGGLLRAGYRSVENLLDADASQLRAAASGLGMLEPEVARLLLHVTEQKAVASELRAQMARVGELRDLQAYSTGLVARGHTRVEDLALLPAARVRAIGSELGMEATSIGKLRAYVRREQGEGFELKQFLDTHTLGRYHAAILQEGVLELSELLTDDEVARRELAEDVGMRPREARRFVAKLAERAETQPL